MRRLLIALTLVCFAATASADELVVGWDGSHWNQLKGKDGAMQIVLVRGIYEGLIWGRSPDISKYYRKTSYDHMAKALDQFYADYRNEKVFIVWALQVIAMELSGESPERVEDHLRSMRKAASEVERKRP